MKQFFRILPLAAALLSLAPAARADDPPPPNVAAPLPPLSPEMLALSLPKDGRFIAAVSTNTKVGAYVMIPQAPRPQPTRDWLVAVYRTPLALPAGRVSYVASLYDLDCGQKLATSRMTIFYDAAGRELSRQPDQGPQRAKKGSPLATAFYLVCQGGQPKGRIVQGIEGVLADSAPRK